jgi:uncharacterized membrane protein YkoI
LKLEVLMISRRLKWVLDGLFIVITGMSLAMSARAQDKGKADLDKIPRKVIDALKTRFPNPEIHHWTSEKENNIVLYDIEFRQRGRKYEADIAEDGAIQNWEKEMAVGDVPAVVRKAVDAKYRKATLKAAMAITDVKDGKDVPAGYEIILETADRKEVEVTVAPDGRVLEDSGKEK